MAIDQTALGARSEARVFTYDWRKAALYALAVGARRDELDYLYEARGPRVLPTFAVLPTMDPVFECLQRVGAELALIVHFAQEIRLHGPLPPAGSLRTVAEVKHLYDMKKMVQIVVSTESRDEGDALLAESEWTILMRGGGGFGGPPPPRKPDAAPVPRDRPADFVHEETTSPEQALLYRLTGDLNPLHADPAVAAQAGFAQGPILHGLCTFGHAARALIKAGLGGDGARLSAMSAQFRRPVWPGDTLRTEGWRLDDGLVALQTTAVGRPEPVLTAAWARVTTTPPEASS